MSRHALRRGSGQITAARPGWPESRADRLPSFQLARTADAGLPIVMAFQQVLRPSELIARFLIDGDNHPFADTGVEAIAVGAPAAPRVTARWPTDAFPEG